MRESSAENFIARLLEYAITFALSVFFIRLGLRYLQEIWLPFTVIAVIILVILISRRVWQNKTKW